MAVKIIDQGWEKTFKNLSKIAKERSFIISPFVAEKTLKDLLGEKPKEVKVITRFNLNELLLGVSDINALEYLIAVGAEVKGIKHLHSKVYIFGDSPATAVITSANLTQAALHRNT